MLVVVVVVVVAVLVVVVVVVALVAGVVVAVWCRCCGRFWTTTTKGSETAHPWSNKTIPTKSGLRSKGHEHFSRQSATAQHTCH